MKCKCDMRTKLVGDGCEACNPQLVLDMALGAYWDAAVAEGAEGRDHDTPDGDAQRALEAVHSAVAAMVAAERERCERNSEHEFELGRKRRFEFEPGFTRVMQCKRITSDWAAPEQWSAWKCVQSRSPARATEACADVAKPPDANEG